jgi:nitroreductase
MNYLEALSRRYSVKKFNHQIIPQETLHNILESGKLSASSQGLQPYKIVIVESEEMKQKMIPAFITLLRYPPVPIYRYYLKENH